MLKALCIWYVLVLFSLQTMLTQTHPHSGIGHVCSELFTKKWLLPLIGSFLSEIQPYSSQQWFLMLSSYPKFIDIWRWGAYLELQSPSNTSPMIVLPLKKVTMFWFLPSSFDSPDKSACSVENTSQLWYWNI